MLPLASQRIRKQLKKIIEKSKKGPRSRNWQQTNSDQIGVVMKTASQCGKCFLNLFTVAFE